MPPQSPAIGVADMVQPARSHRIKPVSRVLLITTVAWAAFLGSMPSRTHKDEFRCCHLRGMVSYTPQGSDPGRIRKFCTAGKTGLQVQCTAATGSDCKLNPPGDCKPKARLNKASLFMCGRIHTTHSIQRRAKKKRSITLLSQQLPLRLILAINQ